MKTIDITGISSMYAITSVTSGILSNHLISQRMKNVRKDRRKNIRRENH